MLSYIRQGYLDLLFLLSLSFWVANVQLLLNHTVVHTTGISNHKVWGNLIDIALDTCLSLTDYILGMSGPHTPPLLHYLFICALTLCYPTHPWFNVVHADEYSLELIFYTKSIELKHDTRLKRTIIN